MDKVLGRGSPKVDGLCINSNNNYSKRGRGRGLAAWWFEEKGHGALLRRVYI